MKQTKAAACSNKETIIEQKIHRRKPELTYQPLQGQLLDEIDICKIKIMQIQWLKYPGNVGNCVSC